MKLILKQYFSIEIPQHDKKDKVITGFLTPNTPKQLKEFKKDTKASKKLVNKMQALMKKIKFIPTDKEGNSDDMDAAIEALESIQDEIDDIGAMEIVSEKRFLNNIESDDMEFIKKVCDLIGFSKVMKTIDGDILEKMGNDTPA